MLDALGGVLDVRFEERMLGDGIGIDAWILPEAGLDTLRSLAFSGRPSYAVIRKDQQVPCGTSSTIEFSGHSALPPVLRGRQIRTDEAAGLTSLPHLDNVTVLASKAAVPVWTMQEHEGCQHHCVASPVPELNDGESLFQYFCGRRFMQLLPLILFLRTLTEDQGWEQPPLQACFMFDDPNLHWRTYGFIDFNKIASHAQLHRYHACFATIPLDAWFVHKPTALLFQRHRDRLSLLVHGNDHIAQELAKPYVEEEQKRNLQQALGRISAFERRSGVEVSKVMVPPHGACIESALGEMARLGFEAACISKGSLRHYNGQAAWLRTFGMKPADIIGGLPVFPRFPLSGSCRNSILIAALLHQPIIAMGHHHDVAEGLHQFDDLAGFINSLGTVRWVDMKRISRAHYAQKLDGKDLLVRMFTRRIEVLVPERARQLLLERPLLRGAGSAPFAWRLLSEGSEWKVQRPDEPISVLSGQKIEIASEPPTASLVDARNIRKPRLWPVVRRQLTEARDRLAPVLRRVSAFSVKPYKPEQ